MSSNSKRDELQRAHYVATADHYDTEHVQLGDEHYVALNYVIGLLAPLGVRTILDIGAGTGRAVEVLRLHVARVWGVEPISALIDRGRRAGRYRAEVICGDGRALPFRDRSVDAVCAFGVLHHVKRPAVVVNEMTRVARSAVFISDSNRFGQGSRPMRYVKLGLSIARLWPFADFARTRGRGYHYSEGDGVFYSYSVYDNLAQLARWADRILMLPTERGKASSQLHPLTTSGHILVCALKEATGDDR